MSFLDSGLFRHESRPHLPGRQLPGVQRGHRDERAHAQERPRQAGRHQDVRLLPGGGLLHGEGLHAGGRHL